MYGITHYMSFMYLQIREIPDGIYGKHPGSSDGETETRGRNKGENAPECPVRPETGQKGFPEAFGGRRSADDGRTPLADRPVAGGTILRHPFPAVAAGAGVHGREGRAKPAARRGGMARPARDAGVGVEPVREDHVLAGTGAGTFVRDARGQVVVHPLPLPVAPGAIRRGRLPGRGDIRAVAGIARPFRDGHVPFMLEGAGLAAGKEKEGRQERHGERERHGGTTGHLRLHSDLVGGNGRPPARLLPGPPRRKQDTRRNGAAHPDDAPPRGFRPRSRKRSRLREPAYHSSSEMVTSLSK